MKANRLFAVSLTTLLFLGLSFSGVSASSAGQKCSKVGALSGTKQSALVCTKVNKKLVWKVVATTTTSARVTTTTVAASTTTVAATTTTATTTTTVPKTTTTTVTSTKPVMSNLSYLTTIRPGTSLTVAFTVTSIIGINKNASGIVTFMHEGGGGSFGAIFSEWSNNFCVRTSELSLNCEGAIQISETAVVGSYRLSIIGFRNPNNVDVGFSQSRALIVAT